MSKPEDLRLHPIDQIGTGRFIKTQNWYQLLSDPVPAPTHTESCPAYTVQTRATDGEVGPLTLYGLQVWAVPAGIVPNAFRPSVLRNRSSKDRREAASILNRATAREALAREMAQLINAQKG